MKAERRKTIRELKEEMEVLKVHIKRLEWALRKLGFERMEILRIKTRTQKIDLSEL